MSDSSLSPSVQVTVERKKKVNCIDLIRAYDALIHGYIQVYTAQKLQKSFQRKMSKEKTNEPPFL